MRRARRSGQSSISHVTMAFAAIVLAMLPGVLDQTVLATALPTIAGDLGRLTDVSWIITAYVVAAAATTPLWGKLGDRHGRKHLIEIALVTFLAASALCGLAQSVAMLIVARAVQGAGAGGLMSLAMAAVGDLVSPRERARYQGYIVATFAVATIAGPLAGGLIVEHVSWRWVFYLNLPLGLAALAGLHLHLPAGTVERPAHRLDLVGAGLLAAATSALLLACIWGGDRYTWGSAPIIGLIAATLVLALGLVVRERHVPDPIVPIALLRTRTVALVSASLFLTTASLFAVIVFVPLLLQATTGATPTQAGLLLVPMMLGITLSTGVAGRVIARTGRYKAFPIGGLALMCAGLVELAVTATQTSRTMTALGLVVFGLGFGVVGQVLTVAVQNDVDRRQLGIAMAATSFFRGLGGAIGAAVLGAVFAAHTGTTGGGGIASLGAAGRTGIAEAAQTVFLVAVPISASALLVALFVKERPLRTAQPATPAAKHAAAREPRPAAS
jgi:EmrB/QacA subfamily drug resistance transporter